MKKVLIFLFTALIVFTLGACKDDSANCCDPILDTQANVILIIADDLGKDACIGYSQGVDKPNMPTLASIISEGILFENFWVHPLCTPTRSSIFTGKYPLRNDMLEVGDHLDINETSLFDYFQEKIPDVYSTALIGKWHLGSGANHPSDLGVPHYSGLLSGAVKSYTQWDWTHDGSTETSQEYTTTKFTDLAINWVDKQTKPWFLWLAYNAPHTPFHLPPANLHTQTGLSGSDADIAATPLPYFLAAIEAMDSEIGRLLASLSEEERENTYIIFIGDNGTPQQVAQTPYGTTKAKSSLYLGGVNTPMIISGPGISGPSVNTENFIQSTDLFTTIAQLCGAGSSDFGDSKSFYPILQGSNVSTRDYLYSEIGGTNLAGHGLRNDSFAIINYDNRANRFFNLMDDPEQNTNLNTQTLDADAQRNKTELQLQIDTIRQ
jgi:arylsulfatase A-like enzyme